MTTKASDHMGPFDVPCGGTEFAGHCDDVAVLGLDEILPLNLGNTPIEMLNILVHHYAKPTYRDGHSEGKVALLISGGDKLAAVSELLNGRLLRQG